MNLIRNNSYFFILSTLLLLLSSCSVSKKIGAEAEKDILSSEELRGAQAGICIYEPATNSYWYKHQSDHFFTPASNTKIFTCYAALKHLGDSLNGIIYAEKGDTLFLRGTGDPTFLHPDYATQPVIRFLQKSTKQPLLYSGNWQSEKWGDGWAWDDYNSDYMPERSSMPVYGNTIKFVQTQTEESNEALDKKLQPTVYTEPEINWKLNFSTDTGGSFAVRRNADSNLFTVTEGKEKYKEQLVPFITHGTASAIELLKDTSGKSISAVNHFPIGTGNTHSVKSQPLDSVLAPMMHRSDNFFAEQLLLMVSDQMLGYMNDGKIIDSLLKSDYRELPQKPSWVDGSGLSRYNFSTPENFVWILNRMKNEFSWQRLTRILATGNQGTLTGYYLADSSFVYAKTGTLRSVVALSGYLITLHNKTLIFSVLVNNHQSSGRAVRRDIEKFLQAIRKNY